MAYLSRQRLELIDPGLCEIIMTLNLPKTLLTAAFLLVAACMLATVLMADNSGKDRLAAPQQKALPNEDIPELDWSVYRVW